MALGDGIDRARYDMMRTLMLNEPHLFGKDSILSLYGQGQGDITQAQIAQSQWAQSQQQLAAQQSPPMMKPPTPSLPMRAKELFLKRMGGIRAEMTMAPNDFLQMHVFEDQVIVFFCFNGKEGVVKEQMDIFPSDQLIAQFRMILA